MAERTNPAPSRIYVSCGPGRTGETGTSLIDVLRQRFGAERIVSSSDLGDAPPGHQVLELERALDSSHALVVLIGSNWLRWLSDPVDTRTDPFTVTFLELSTALARRHLTVLAVLIDGAQMPAASDLPTTLASLAHQRRFEVGGTEPARVIGDLIEALDRSARVAQLVGEARAALDAGRYEVALRAAQVATAVDPECAAAGEIAAAAAERSEAQRRELSEALARQLQEREELERQRRAAEHARRLERQAPEVQSRTAPVPAAPAPLPHRGAVDENVQFTVFRRSSIQPGRWYPLLAFAHLAGKRPDAEPDEPDPVEEVRAQAARVLGQDLEDFRSVTQDSAYAVMREGELRFVPRVDGVQFNPPERRFLWTETVHREDFRMRADESMVGRVARGTLTVYSGNLLLADVQLSVRVDRRPGDTRQAFSAARPYRRIFASYSHRDVGIVEEFEAHARATGDQYLRDVVSLRAGEAWTERLVDLINRADVFQLFWSWNALESPIVAAEWQHALALKRPHFIRPVYWEDPFPERQDLPPPSLKQLHFQRVYPRTGRHTVPPGPPVSRPEPARMHEEKGQASPVGPRKPPTRGRAARVAKYGAVAAVCVIAAGVYVAIRPQLVDPADNAPAVSAPPDPSSGNPDLAPPPPPPAGVPPGTGGGGSSVVTPSPNQADRPGAPGANPRISASPAASIEGTIVEYERGMNAMDLERLRRVWEAPEPAARNLRATFSRARALEVRVRVRRVSRPSDTRAEVVVDEVRQITWNTGEKAPPVVRSRVFHLARRGSEWRIVSIVD